MVTVLVMLAEYVRDIEAIFKVLLSPASQCLASEVTECLYAIATFLFMFRSIKYSDVWTGYEFCLVYNQLDKAFIVSTLVNNLSVNFKLI